MAPSLGQPQKSHRISKSLHVPPFTNVFIVLSTILVTTPPFFYLVTKGSRGFVTELNDQPCVSDGTFISGLFAVNLAFGRYSFATVKLIDVLWDILVGRGLQIILAVTAYHVYKMALLRAMESYTASYELFLATGVQQNTFSMVSALFLEMVKKRRVHHQSASSKTILAAIFATVIYIAAWPTLTSAMTGYTPFFDIMMNLRDNTAVPMKQLEDAAVIHDGYRLVLQDKVQGSVAEHVALGCQSTSDDSQKNSTTVIEDTLSRDTVLTYDATYGWHVSTSEVDSSTALVSRFVTVGVENYVNYYYNAGQYPVNDTAEATKICFNGTLLRVESPPLNISLHWYGYNGGAYEPDYATKHRVCQPSNIYQWGFSYDLALVWSICNLVLASVLYGLWIDAYRNSRMVQGKRTGGVYRTLLDLAAAIQEDFESESIRDHAEKELVEKIGKAKGGVTVLPDSLRVSGRANEENGDEEAPKVHEHEHQRREGRTWGERLISDRKSKLHFLIEA